MSDLLIGRPIFQKLLNSKLPGDETNVPGKYFIEACSTALILDLGSTKNLPPPFYGFSYCTGVTESFKAEFEKFLEQNGFVLLAQELEKEVTSKYPISALYSNDVAMLKVDGYAEEGPHDNETVSINGISLTATIGQTIIRMMVESNKTIGKEQTLSVLCQSSSGFYDRELKFHSKKLERGNYSKEIVKKYQQLLDILPGKDPPGRLTILEGPPGVGKTYLIRSLLAEAVGCKFLVIPPNLVPEIDQPGLISFFLDQNRGERRPLVLILEDADSCLSVRDVGNMSGISSLLNLTDGLIGSLLDIRILASTNASKLEIDPALLRKGRLLSYLSIGELSPEKAEEIYTRLTNGPVPEDITLPKTLAEIYALALGEKEDSEELIERPSNRKTAGFGRRE